MGNGSGINTKFCVDCNVKFSVTARAPYEKLYCPVCADDAGVRRYDRLKHDGSKHMPAWTTLEEQEAVSLALEGHNPIGIVSRISGRKRSVLGVQRKLMRLGYKFDRRTKTWTSF